MTDEVPANAAAQPAHCKVVVRLVGSRTEEFADMAAAAAWIEAHPVGVRGIKYEITRPRGVPQIEYRKQPVSVGYGQDVIHFETKPHVRYDNPTHFVRDIVEAVERVFADPED